MIYIYKVLGLILIPLIKLNVTIRIIRGKEMPNRYKERFGESAQLVKNDKKLIWIHAASVGEFKSSDYIIKNYHEKYKILITTTTVSAAKYAIKTYGNKIIHQFAPLDVSIWIKKFLKRWNPTLIIWIESDLWPATLSIIKEFKINALLVNVRLSPKSFKRWILIPSFYNNLLSCFSDIFAQSKADQKRINKLSNKKIKFIGNLKLTSSNFNSINNTVKNTQNAKNIVNIMLASTHKNEENEILSNIKGFLKENNNIKLIIAPRHPERSEEISSLCKSFNLSSTLESKKNLEEKNVIIIDSFGILTKYFALSDIVILGGSFVPSGGHNPIEPALNKCVILTGPKIFNWEEIFNEMIKSNACIKVETYEELKNKLKVLMKDKNKIEFMKTNAYNFSQKQFINTTYLDEAINNHMNIN